MPQMSHLRRLLLLSFSLLHPTSSITIPPPITYTLLGSLSGSAGALAVYPIDYVKSQLQTSSGRLRYSSGLDAFVKIVSTEGPLALYRGALVQVIGIAPEKTIKLSVNDSLKGVIAAGFSGGCPLWGEVVSGGCAGFCQVLVTNPLEVVKVKIQTTKKTSNDDTNRFEDIWNDIIKDGLFNGLYKGTSACIVRDILFNALLFPLYAHARLFVPSLLDLPPSSLLVDALAGGLAAIPAAFVATPADVIKTRMQQSRNRLTMGDVDYSELGFVEAVRRLYDEGGWEALFSGALERVVRSIPQFAVTLALFDFLKGLALQYGLLV